MMLRDSKDEKVRQAGIEVKTGRKWSAHKALRDAEGRLHHADIVGTVAQGRLGLGCVTRASWAKATQRERRGMVQKEVRRGEEESRQAKAASMGKQGSWTRWEGVQERTLSWQDVWNMEGYRIKFLLSSVYDVLPTPSNLHTWGLAESPCCTLCGKTANLEHVLSSCRANLADGKFRWRHDQVLTKLAEGLEQARRKQRKLSKGPQCIKFLRAGETSAPQLTARGILATANDWEMRADLRRQLKFPEEITTTSSRPDVVLWSKATKQVALVELTVPWEERMEEAHEFKCRKYQALILQCQQNGWKAWNLPVEVGCRGFAGRALWRTLGQLGIEGLTRKQLINSMTKQAEVASRWIWLNRDKRWEKPTPGI